MNHGSDGEASECVKGFRQVVCRNKALVATRRYLAEGSVSQIVMRMMRDREGHQNRSIEVQPPSITPSVVTPSLHAAQMPETFLTVLVNSLRDVEFSLRNALMQQNTVNFYQTGATARRTQSKLLRPFADFQLRPRTQPVASTQRFGKNNSAEFVQFEFHSDGNMGCQIWAKRPAVSRSCSDFSGLSVRAVKPVGRFSPPG